MGWHPIVRSCDDNHKEVTTNQKKLNPHDHPRVDSDDEYGRTTQRYVSEGSFTRTIEDCRFIRQRVAVRCVKSISNAQIYLVRQGSLLVMSTG